MERKSTRSSELRQNNMMKQYNMGYVSPLDLPPGVAREGFKYSWEQRECHGQPNHRIEMLASQGWTLVPSDRAPMFSVDPLKRNPISNQYLCYKDLILMEAHEELAEMKERYYNDMTREQLNNIEGVETDLIATSNPIKSLTRFNNHR